jgi:hypothetical protein
MRNPFSFVWPMHRCTILQSTAVGGWRTANGMISFPSTIVTNVLTQFGVKSIFKYITKLYKKELQPELVLLQAFFRTVFDTLSKVFPLLSFLPNADWCY